MVAPGTGASTGTAVALVPGRIGRGGWQHAAGQSGDAVAALEHFTAVRDELEDAVRPGIAVAAGDLVDVPGWQGRDGAGKTDLLLHDEAVGPG